MNKIIIFFIFSSLGLSSIEIFWDLGLGISDFKVSSKSQNLDLSTFHRFEGVKKYYNNDYKSAIYHFSQLNHLEQNYILYEYLDSYYELEQLSEAINLLHIYNNSKLSDNIIYLKSKIYIKLKNYEEALNNLNYLISFHSDSDYSNIVRFDIEKINLLIK